MWPYHYQFERWPKIISEHKEISLTKCFNLQKDHELNNHIVICAFGDDKTPISGLSSLIKPLRASNLPYKVGVDQDATGYPVPIRNRPDIRFRPGL